MINSQKGRNSGIITLLVCLVPFLFLLMAVQAMAQSDTLVAKSPSARLYGRTTGDLPGLKFGPGTDRLGGARMSLIDTAIVMQITDSLNSDYIVRLSSTFQAFIPKENMRIVPGYTPPPYILSSSWSVKGDDRCDYLTIALDERVPFRSQQLTNPSRIVVDLFGVTPNTNWITQLKSAREIRNVDYEQLADGVMRVTIELTHPRFWGHTIRYRNKALTITVRRPPAKPDLRHLKIAVDAGHGGAASGAVGVKSGILEKDCNLKIAGYLAGELRRKGATVVMTRTGDEDLTMVQRLKFLEQENPDLLISIHHNAAGNSAARGVSTYYRHIGFKPLSVAILDRMLPLGLNEFGTIGRFNFALNAPSDYPNALVEVAFMSNEEDEKRIVSDEFQRQVARAIRKGISDWLANGKQGEW